MPRSAEPTGGKGRPVSQFQFLSFPLFNLAKGWTRSDAFSFDPFRTGAWAATVQRDTGGAVRAESALPARARRGGGRFAPGCEARVRRACEARVRRVCPRLVLWSRRQTRPPLSLPSLFAGGREGAGDEFPLQAARPCSGPPLASAEALSLPESAAAGRFFLPFAGRGRRPVSLVERESAPASSPLLDFEPSSSPFHSVAGVVEEGWGVWEGRERGFLGRACVRKSDSGCEKKIACRLFFFFFCRSLSLSLQGDLVRPVAPVHSSYRDKTKPVRQRRCVGRNFRAGGWPGGRATAVGIPKRCPTTPTIRFSFPSPMSLFRNEHL